MTREEHRQAMRARILELLDGWEADTTSLARALGVTYPTAWKWLQHLENDELITSRRGSGRTRLYTIVRPPEPRPPRLQAALDAALEAHPELAQAIRDHLDPPRVSPTKRRPRPSSSTPKYQGVRNQ